MTVSLPKRVPGDILWVGIESPIRFEVKGQSAFTALADPSILSPQRFQLFKELYRP
jgi:hypothetical protein